MESQLNHRTERLAKASRVLGYLSFGFILLPPFILLISVGYIGESAFFVLISFSIVVALIIGLSGFTAAITALGKIRQGGGDKKIKKMAIFGLIISCLGVFISSVPIILTLLT